MGAISSNSTPSCLGNDSLVMGAATVTGGYLSGDAGNDTTTVTTIMIPPFTVVTAPVQ